MESSLTQFVAYPLAIGSLAFLYLRVLLECWLYRRAGQGATPRRPLRDQTLSRRVLVPPAERRDRKGAH